MNVALIGTGRIAREHLACLRHLPGVALVGVCDRSPALAELAADEFGVPAWFHDHREMLERLRPEVVHITTPPTSHFPLAMDVLRAGAHAIVEKPVTATLEEFLALKRQAGESGRVLIENYNYLFNRSVQQLLGLLDSGAMGDVVHVEVHFGVDILGPGSPFVDPNLPHPCLAMRGGAIADLLPHIASMACRLTGPHRAVRTLWRRRNTRSPLPSDEFRALVDGERATAALAFSSHAQPNHFCVRVHGTRMRAEADLLEPRLLLDRQLGGHPALLPLRNGLAQGRAAAGAALGGFRRRLAGRPVAYEGIGELLSRTYHCLASGQPPPIPMDLIEATNRLIDDLTREEFGI